MICTTAREPQRLIIEQQNLHCPRYVPKIKDAGFHTVYFRILRNGYKTVTGKEKVILRTYGSSIKRDPTVTLPVKLSLNYNGIDQSLLKAGATTSGTLKYALGTDEKTVPERGWRRTVPKGNQAGVYHVWFKVEGNDDYNSIPAMHIPVTIAESRPPYRPRPDTSVKEYEEKVSAAKAKKVKIKSFKAKKNKKKLEVKWKKLSGVSGYEIQYTASKTFTKKNTKKTLKKLTAGPKTTKKTLMKLSSKRKTYRIRIRSFTKVKNPTTGKYEKIRGKWSAIKKAKA